MVGSTGIQRAAGGLLTDQAAAPAAVPLRRGPAWALIGLATLLAAAVILRLVPIIVVPSVNWWDEVFQSTEQAHRLVYGYGLVPWEFQLGARSWLLPGVVAGLIELARLIGDGPDYYLPLIATVFASLAAATVYCCFQWCRRRYGLSGAFVGAAVVVIAPELVYFGGRVLSEVIAAHLLVVAFYLLEPGYKIDSRRRVMVAGALFALACLLRIQLAPAAAVIALWPSQAGWRHRLLPLAAGGLAVVALGGLLDTLTLGYPFASIWRYVLYNVHYSVSSYFGTEPWDFYLLGEFGLWGGISTVVLLAAVFGGWRVPALLAGAVVIIAVHSGIAHKEYRFIYPAVLLVTIMIGMGFARLSQEAARILRDRGITRQGAAACAVFLVGYWVFAAAHVWTGETMVSLRLRVHDNLAAAAFTARMPALCGLGLYGVKGQDWARYGGYTMLHRPVPLFWPENEQELSAAAPGFNVLLYTPEFSVPPPPVELGYQTIACFGMSCVAQRPGACAAVPPPAMPFPDPLVGMAPPPATFVAVPASVLSRSTRP
jgi:phosphatidylinositol glycan class B